MTQKILLLLLVGLSLFLARPALSIDNGDFFRSGANDDLEDQLRGAEAGALFLERAGKAGNSKGSSKRKLSEAREKSATLDNYGLEDHVSLEQVLMSRRDARMLSELDMMTATRGRRLNEEKDSEAPVEAPIEAPVEAPADDIVIGDNDFGIRFKLGWTFDSYRPNLLNNRTFLGAYEGEMEPNMESISGKQSDTGVEGVCLTTGYQNSASRRLLTAQEELAMSDSAYFSAPALDSIKALDVMFVDAKIKARRLQSTGGGFKASQTVVYKDDGSGNAASNGQGMGEFLVAASQNKALMQEALQAEGYTGSIGGFDVGFPTVEDVEIIAPNNGGGGGDSKSSNGAAIGAGIGGAVGGAALVGIVGGAVYYQKVVKPKRLAAGAPAA